jgi:hypothetical protein
MLHTLSVRTFEIDFIPMNSTPSMTLVSWRTTEDHLLRNAHEFRAGGTRRLLRRYNEDLRSGFADDSGWDCTGRNVLSG